MVITRRAGRERMAGCLRFTRPRPLTRKCARRRDQRREWLADDQSRKPERSRSQVRSTPPPRHRTLPAAAYFMTSPIAAIISRREEYSFASSIGTGSLHGEAPRSEARGLHPRGAHAARFRPRPSSIPRKKYGQLHRRQWPALQTQPGPCLTQAPGTHTAWTKGATTYAPGTQTY